ncbi:hypothetical protein [Kushneria phyllosphaerae]|uniref:Lipoprotein n=1 Tax=Kushneria phyllosphaerae TaxID=2100822 RepID=A0A2R8CHJ7_9GAMM|nr:hypothetical protein [Kushneria phyllosphaerae]SPJ32378.1 hypothetical protein KSP9073_00378 [Kushneria phyllosphaerae]
MKAGFCMFAMVIALSGCTSEAPDRSDDGLVLKSGSYTLPIQKECVSNLTLDHDDASKPMVMVELVQSSECSGALKEFTDTHVGDPMSIQFGDEDQGMTLDSNMLGATDAPFIVQVESDDQGQTIVDYYR